jgi:hypothetical protein
MTYSDKETIIHGPLGRGHTILTSRELM